MNFSEFNRLEHYFLYVEPNPKLMARRSTKIEFNGNDYEFEGFSVFFHRPLPNVFPQNPMSRWISDYKMRFLKEDPPKVFKVDIF